MGMPNSAWVDYNLLTSVLSEYAYINGTGYRFGPMEPFNINS